ncbi:hypothetical protein [Thiobacillus sp.]|uniref:Abi-alpha family protein n=1 Tax=Thiobacillus sp. TaxID=924 RepID=UPI00286EACF5|nr:hypothetical protein [Thiobacillus sp.]
MPESENRSLDILGIKPVGESLLHVTQASVDGASSFLAKICLPAAEEFGLLLQDKVRAWRANNAVHVVEAAQAKFGNPPVQMHAHPRLVASIIDHGSWTDDPDFQTIWGGLLASSCSLDGKDDSNLIFVNLLSNLTGIQIRVLAYACEQCNKKVSPFGLIGRASDLQIDEATLYEITGSTDLHRIDRELDNLRGLELIHNGIDMRSKSIEISPTSLALNLYVRCQGFVGSPVTYFGIRPTEPQ